MSNSCVVLDDRILWKDGYITIDPSDVFDHISHLECVTVTETTDIIDQYNKFVKKTQRIPIGVHKPSQIEPIWRIPEQYAKLNVIEYAIDKNALLYSVEQWSSIEYNNRIDRLRHEYSIYQQHNLLPLLCTLIFIINTMKQQNLVWGTGRGSSTSSYLLYVLEVHDVDSYAYNINFSDFIK